jgi:adenylate kinase family enzyme
MKPKKIAILGVTGSGKSTFSRKLAEKTKLPLFHMDALFWKAGWTETPEIEYLEGQQKILLNNNAWIIEGWINNALSERVRQADLILYLDYPGWIAASRYVLRAIMHRKVARPELPPDCVDRFKLHRFLMILFRGEHSEIEDALKHVKDRSRIIRFTAPSAARAYLETQP